MANSRTPADHGAGMFLGGDFKLLSAKKGGKGPVLGPVKPGAQPNPGNGYGGLYPPGTIANKTSVKKGF